MIQGGTAFSRAPINNFCKEFLLYLTYHLIKLVTAFLIS